MNIILASNKLREVKRLFHRLKHQRCTLPVLNHILLTADHTGIRLAATNLDQWLETQITDQPSAHTRFLIPPSALDAACRADKGTNVTMVSSDNKPSREITLTVQCGGITTASVHPTLDPAELPQRPSTFGITTPIPSSTLQSLAQVAGCASSDPTRHVLNGVYFTPDDGGNIVATDGRRLACSPAIVPPQAFILPNNACNILSHPDFLKANAEITWVDHEKAEQRQVAIRCGNHLLITKPIIGSYPNYKQVIPQDTAQSATIAADQLPGLIAWLRAMGNAKTSVQLEWLTPGQLSLTHRDAQGHSATMQIPVSIQGNLPVIAFQARNLADALAIGSTLHLSHELNPGVCRHPNGQFCVLMPMRVSQTTQQKQPQAA